MPLLVQPLLQTIRLHTCFSSHQHGTDIQMCQAVWNISKSKISKSDLTRCPGVFLIRVIYSRCLLKEKITMLQLGCFDLKVTSIQTFGRGGPTDFLSSRFIFTSSSTRLRELVYRLTERKLYCFNGHTDSLN